MRLFAQLIAERRSRHETRLSPLDASRVGRVHRRLGRPGASSPLAIAPNASFSAARSGETTRGLSHSSLG
jgi:hypothetical protein